MSTTARISVVTASSMVFCGHLRAWARCSKHLQGCARRRNVQMSKRKLTRQDLRDAAEKYKNWGKWGPADEIGTLNFTAPEDIVAAARLVKKGKVISLA